MLVYLDVLLENIQNIQHVACKTWVCSVVISAKKMLSRKFELLAGLSPQFGQGDRE